MMMAVEVQQHLKDHLYHGVPKHICDSVQYLYSAPDTFYSQLMVAARKAESENEEIQEKARARAMVTSVPNWWLPWCRPDRTSVPPIPKVVPRNVAADRVQW